ncbi:hypothetical protein [Burkholderia plantarii]|uniref:Uncharacterized protein n=1 Tax=Burkholderia plantarii TaxID=41899 RepID=A0A0B6S338_BURPL|nr:hypothetical protein [Burkholderia plantarii]AJK50083.1 hypothetical protein BGL_2c20190 [Burkholderia plantarii]GLZ20609.1 hypothetical protein Bpla01_41380 [Burkholderia plantarii]
MALRILDGKVRFMNDALIQHVAAQIAQYLQMNPAAADTVEGIHHFWVGAQTAQQSLELTQAALDYLLARGEVARVPIGNRMLWRAPRDGA